MKRSCFLIPVLNAQSTIAETLESLLLTASSPEALAADVVLLDGGSTDETYAVVENLSRKCSRIKWNSLPGSHPADRVNSVIEDSSYDVAMMCHADDVYDADARVAAAEEMLSLGHWLRGTMHGYYQDPLSAIMEGRTQPYSGTHGAYPTSGDSVWAELPFWWCVSLNTVALDLTSIRHSGIRYDWRTYKYCADHWFNWHIAKHRRASNSELVTTITRHDLRGDGPTNAPSLALESGNIRRRIAEEIGIAERIRPELLELLLGIRYSYGAATPPVGALTSDLGELASALHSFHVEHRTEAAAATLLAGFSRCAMM